MDSGADLVAGPTGLSRPTDGQSAEPAGARPAHLTVEEIKEQGNVAFTKARLFQRTTAGKQFLQEAKTAYAEAITQLSEAPAEEGNLALVCTLHTNLAAVFLMEVPPQWDKAKAAADIALTVNSRHVKALYRRAQARLEDGREGLPEEALRAAQEDFQAALDIEPRNAQVKAEAERIQRRIAALEESRRVPDPVEIMRGVQSTLLDRGEDCLLTHGYAWGQTAEAIHVFVPARAVRVAKASDVVFEVRVNFLRVALLSTSGTPLLELKGALHKPVRPDDCSWQLEDKGLLLHVELAKRETGPKDEHWLCVWAGHPQTRSPSAEEHEQLHKMARAACVVQAEEEAKPKVEHPAKEETLRRIRELCPGANVEWGDTSLESFC